MQQVSVDMCSQNFVDYSLQHLTLSYVSIVLSFYLFKNV